MACCLAWHGQTIHDVAALAESVDYRTYVKIGRSWRFRPLSASTPFEQDALLVPRELTHKFVDSVIEAE
jgi:hypothetical protein